LGQPRGTKEGVREGRMLRRETEAQKRETWWPEGTVEGVKVTGRHKEEFKIARSKGGATNLKVGGQCIGRWGVQTVKTLQFEKEGGA